MIPFAVSIEGVSEEGQALWVLAVDPIGERLLTAYPDRSLHWLPMADCTFAKLIPPDAAKPVILVQPQAAPGALALPNRAMRRNGV